MGRPCIAPAVLLGGLFALLAAVRLEGGDSAPSRTAPRGDLEVLDVEFLEETGRALAATGGWLPVYVELKCQSQHAVTATIEGTVARGTTKRFAVRKTIDVAPGAPRRVWLYLKTSAGGDQQETASINVRSATRGLVRTGDRWGLLPYGPGEIDRILVVGEGVASELPWPQGSLSASLLARGKKGEQPTLDEAVDELPARALPDSVLGYQAVDVVILRGDSVKTLEARQVEALRSWVYLGGLLIAAPASGSGDLFRSSLLRSFWGDALSEPSRTEAVIGTLGRIDATRRPENPGSRKPRSLRFPPAFKSGTVTLTLLDPFAASPPWEIRSFFENSGGTVEERRLYGERRYGQGRVGCVTFAHGVRRQETADFQQQLWSIILLERRGSRPAAPSGFSRNAAATIRPRLEALLNDPSRDVGLTFIVGLVAAYLVLVGPVLYGVLRRRKRLTSVIWVEPLVVVGYLAIIFGVAYLTKGVLTKTRIWTVISQRRGEPLAVRSSYLTVFSAVEQTYRISAPSGFLLNPVFKNEKEERLVDLRTRRAVGPSRKGDGGGLSLVDYPMTQWEQGHFVNCDILDMKGDGVVVTAVRPGGRKAGLEAVRVRNRLPCAIVEGVVAGDGGEYWPVPRIERGQEVTVRRPRADESGQRREQSSWRKLFDKEAQLHSGGLAPGGSVLFAGAMERSTVDFLLDRPSTMREKTDVYILYSTP